MAENCSLASSAMSAARSAQSTANTARGEAQAAQRTANTALGEAREAYQYAKVNRQKITELEGIVRDLIREVQKLQQNVVNGMENVRRETASVREAVDKSTVALGKIEALRLFNEAEAPINSFRNQVSQVDHKEAFSEREIQNVIGQYDGYFNDAMEENKNKFHEIGSHIYRIHDEDFAALSKESSNTITIHQFQHGNLQIDAHRVSRRNEQLDQNLQDFYEQELEDRIKSMEKFEGAMESRFNQTDLSVDGDVYIPAVTVNVDESTWDLFNNVQVSEEEEFEGIAFELISDPSFNVVNKDIKKNLSKTLKSSKIEYLEDDDLALFKQELNTMVKEGLITEEILVGYLDYIEEFGIQVVS